MAPDSRAAKKARRALPAEALEGLRARCPEAARPEDLEDYCRFLALKVAAKDWYASLLSPPVVVDKIWHAHLLDTLAYEEACAAMGVPRDVRIIHHNPGGGLDAVARAQRQQRALQHYKACWGAPPGGNWGDDRKRAAGPSPAGEHMRRNQHNNDPGGEHSINLKVVMAQDGNEVYFKCKMTTPLQKLMHAFCHREGVSMSSVKFFFDNQRIMAEWTPSQLGMEDGDVIDVLREAQGC